MRKFKSLSREVFSQHFQHHFCSFQKCLTLVRLKHCKKWELPVEVYTNRFIIQSTFSSYIYFLISFRISIFDDFFLNFIIKKTSDLKISDNKNSISSWRRSQFFFKNHKVVPCSVLFKRVLFLYVSVTFERKWDDKTMCQ